MLAAVILSANMVAFHIGPKVIYLYAVDGYVTAWWVGFAFALVGLVAALVLRPRAKDRCEVRAEDLPPSNAQ